MKGCFASLLAIVLCCCLTACTLCKPESPQAQPQAPNPAPVIPESDPIPPAQAGENRVEELGERIDYPAAALRISRPKVTLQNKQAETVINDYYELLAGKVKDYVEGDLTPDPMTEEVFTVTAEYQVMLLTEEKLSILWQVTTASSQETPFSTAVSAASFDIQTGHLLTFDALFGSDATAAKNLFLQKARGDIGALTETNYYYENWWDLVETAFDGDDFYLTDQGVTLFYSQEKLGTYTEISLTWESLQSL